MCIRDRVEGALAGPLGTPTFMHELALVAISGGAGIAVFLAATALLRLEELRWLAGLVARRLRAG